MSESVAKQISRIEQCSILFSSSVAEPQMLTYRTIDFYRQLGEKGFSTSVTMTMNRSLYVLYRKKFLTYGVEILNLLLVSSLPIQLPATLRSRFDNFSRHPLDF